MAEFVEVVRQAIRLCDFYGGDCLKCRLTEGCTCVWQTPRSKQNAVEFERGVLDWAAAHPEPQYPTWKEWQEETIVYLPKEYELTPCMFMERDKWKEISRLMCINCDYCVAQPIPAEIAEKLGIKPRIRPKGEEA